MTKDRFIKSKFDTLIESVEELSRHQERAFNRAHLACTQALENIDKPEVRRQHLLTEFNANLERDCIEVKLKVVKQELKLLLFDLIEIE